MNSCKSDTKLSVPDESESTADSLEQHSIIASICHLLKQILEENNTNKNEEKSSNQSTATIDKCPFACKRPPTVSLFSYYERMSKYTHLEDSTIILSLIFFDRFCEIGKLELNDYNIHRILLASIVVSIKYNEDDYYSNTFYAKVGGIPLRDLNAIENKFVELIDYHFYVDTEIFNQYQKYLNNY